MELTQIGVIIPARDEEATLPACLAALQAAMDVMTRFLPHIRVNPLIVLDRCRDASAVVVARAGVPSISVDVGCVGAARAAGASHVMTRHARAGLAADSLWLAFSDADSQVPPGWLLVHQAFAAVGADALVGTVEPDEHLSPQARRAWDDRHTLTEGHPHVFGANLGVRASTYDRVGRFAPLTAHEDVDLVDRLRKSRHGRVIATDLNRVITSGRSNARTVGGFSTYLDALKATAQG